MTPISNLLAIPLLKGVVRPVLADRTRAEECFPEIRPMPYHEAVSRRWREPGRGPSRPGGAAGAREGEAYRFEDREGLLREIRPQDTPLPPEWLFHAFSSPGGGLYWYLLHPVHKLIFSQMVCALLEEAGGEPGPSRAVKTTEVGA